MNTLNKACCYWLKGLEVPTEMPFVFKKKSHQTIIIGNVKGTYLRNEDQNYEQQNGNKYILVNNGI